MEDMKMGIAEKIANATGMPKSIRPNNTTNTSVIIPVYPPFSLSLIRSSQSLQMPETSEGFRRLPRRN